MEINFSGEVWYWRGPAPFFFVTIPDNESAKIKAISSMATYGWGVIPARVRIGETEFKTSLFPKDGKYIVPVKADVRKAEAIEVGDIVTINLEINF